MNARRWTWVAVAVVLLTTTSTLREVRAEASRARTEGAIGVAFAPVAWPAVVVGVARDGPAARAGLRAGDVVERFGTHAIDGPRTLVDRVRHTRPGTTVLVTVRHGAGRRIVRVTLTGRP